MNKKITALLLAAALTVGVGSYGTYAWFTDQETVDDNVSITMGKLDIKADWAHLSSWKATSDSTEANHKLAKGLSFDNVKPGDTFERKMTVTNIGSLDADVTLGLSEKLEELSDKISVEIVDNENIILPGRWYKIGKLKAQNGDVEEASLNKYSRDFTVKVTVKNLGNEYQDKDLINEVLDFVIVDAIQTGVSK